MVLRWSFAFTRKGLEDGFKEVLGTSSGRRLGDFLKKGRRDFHFRPIYDVFETKTLTSLCRLGCNFIKKETLAQVFPCEFCEISKSTFFYRTPGGCFSSDCLNLL